MKRGIQAALTVIWLGFCLVLLINMGALHNISFKTDFRLQPTQVSSRWSLTHVLGESCKCSERVVEYLLKRGAQPDLDENVLLLGSFPSGEEEKLKALGYHVFHKSPQDLGEDEARGVPFLMIRSAKGESLYAGGYNDHQLTASTSIRDLEILANLRDGKTMASFPVFGCAVSVKYQQLMDPLGMKYSKREANDL